jgi:hypothetical protein
MAQPAVDAQNVQSQMQAMYASLQPQLQQQSSSSSSSSSSSHTPRPPMPKIRTPSTFGGAMGFTADDWIGEMEQQFAYYGAQFHDDAARVRYAVAFLSGAAMHWWEREPANRVVTHAAQPSHTISARSACGHVRVRVTNRVDVCILCNI